MKLLKCFTVPAMLFISTGLFSQNVGIGVATPTETLSIAGGLNIDHNNQNLGSSLLNGLRFGNTAIASEMAGISSNRAGANNLYGLDFYTSNSRRMTILQNGYVGINIVPTNYYLEVGGTVRGSTLRSAGSIIAEGGSVSASGSVSAGTSITAATSITATSGNITASAGDINATNGELLAGGKGVIMSNNATRQRVAVYPATLSVTNLGSGNSVSGTITIAGGTFSAAPTAYVGNVTIENGEFYRAMLVLENVTTTNITVRVVNVSSAAISFSGAQWRILAIGQF